MCGIFLAVIEGVGIGFQRMMAEQTRLDVRIRLSLYRIYGIATDKILQLPPPPPSDSGRMAV